MARIATLKITDLPSNANSLISGQLRKEILNNVNKAVHYPSGRVQLLKETFEIALAKLKEVEQTDEVEEVFEQVGDAAPVVSDSTDNDSGDPLNIFGLYSDETTSGADNNDIGSADGDTGSDTEDGTVAE